MQTLLLNIIKNARLTCNEAVSFGKKFPGLVLHGQITMKFLHKILYRSKGHLVRRCIHIAIGVVPFLYYWHGKQIANWMALEPEQLVILIIITILILEGVRLKKKWVIYGQRPYESTHISAAAWSILSVSLVLLLAPKFGIHGAAFGIPLIWSMCIADPIMGEARGLKFSDRSVFFIGVACITIIWLLCFFWLKTPWYYVLFLPIVTAASELLCIPGLDDNALMTLAPLILILFIHG